MTAIESAIMFTTIPFMIIGSIALFFRGYFSGDNSDRAFHFGEKLFSPSHNTSVSDGGHAPPWMKRTPKRPVPTPRSTRSSDPTSPQAMLDETEELDEFDIDLLNEEKAALDSLKAFNTARPTTTNIDSNTQVKQYATQLIAFCRDLLTRQRERHNQYLTYLRSVINRLEYGTSNAHYNGPYQSLIEQEARAVNGIKKDLAAEKTSNDHAQAKLQELMNLQTLKDWARTGVVTNKARIDQVRALLEEVLHHKEKEVQLLVDAEHLIKRLNKIAKDMKKVASR